MSTDLARDFLKRLDTLKAGRAVWDQHWEEICERILPRYIGFNGERVEGEKRTDKIYEAQPALALERFGSAMDAMLTPQASRWQQLRASNAQLMEIHAVKEYWAEVTKRLFQFRYSTRANFAAQNNERYIMLGALGTGSMFVSERENGTPGYRSVPLQESYVAENEDGFVDVHYREFRMTARQIARRFKDDWNRLPEKIRDDAQDKPEDKHTIVHVVQPRDDRDMGKLDRGNMPWASVYLTKSTEPTAFHIGGENEFPYNVSRYMTAPNEKYGRGPAMIVLPDIKMMNEMSKESVVATHLRNRPPLLAYRDGLLKKFSQRPGAMNRGGINKEGRQLVQPLNTGADPAIADLGIERRQRTVDDAFLVNLMRTLQDHPEMTATQALMLAQERGVVMGPTMGRQQAEAFGPMTERELAILNRGGHLPPMPEEMVEAQGEYEIEFDSPINRAQQAEEGLSVQRTIETMLPLAEIDPEVMDHIDTDEVARLIPEVQGAPPKILRSLDEVLERRQARAAAQQQQQAVEAAPALAQAAKDGAQAADTLSQAGVGDAADTLDLEEEPAENVLPI